MGEERRNESVKDGQSRKGRLGEVSRYSLLIFLGMLLLSTVASSIFYRLAADPSLDIAVVYVLGLFLVARYTDGYRYGLLFVLCSVVCVNFFFTYPSMDLNFTMDGYPVTFAGMLIISMVTSAMTTNMKKQARDLAEKEKELMEAQKEKMRANLLRAVSHDIRTPLAGIIGNSSSYLEMEGELTEEEKTKLVSNIRDDAEWLLHMVENLLSITRIDNETAKVTKSYEAVDEVMESSVTRFRKRFPEVEVRVKVPDDVVMVMMDATLIEQVLINILQNAQLHANSRRPIELWAETRRREVAAGEGRGGEEVANEVVFRVRDYGDGIDEDKLETIFDGEEYSTENRKTDSYKGMGIGLSICKTIVMAHGGTIEAKNHSDGAEVSFSLPLETEE